MKLRNKKTGEIIDRSFIIFRDISPNARIEEPFASISQLNENWEDYKPSEPLIKDEKVRKAVRAWAEALEIECCMYDKGINAFAVGTVMINFPGKLRPETLQNGEIYKIAGLCGEGEE